MKAWRGLQMCQLATLLSVSISLESYEDELHRVLTPSLHHYAPLHPHTVTHTLTGSPSLPHHSRLVEFHTLERNFKLFLKPHYWLFSPGFKVQSIDKRGTLRLHEINQTEYYHGYMGGEEKSIVRAHISEAGIMTASVVTLSETYHFEPSENFIKKPHPRHMIAYRASDVKRNINNLKFDYVVAPPLPPEEQTKTDGRPTPTNPDRGGVPPETHQTVKRQATGSIAGSSCPVLLVSDYRFFDEFGLGDFNESIAGITRRLVTLVSQVDSMIYRDTVWILDPLKNRTVTKLGLEVAGILIHNESFNTSFKDKPHDYYNSRSCCQDLVPGAFDADGLLSAFNFGNWSSYCLAHLFTFTKFSSGLLGLANIASSFRSQTGGICSRGFVDSTRRERIIYNTGISNFMSGEIPLIRTEQILVVGHELGHNWGSHHDPINDPNCDDDFLMNEFAQDGSLNSHFMFSECSRTSIGQVLDSKADCFADRDPCGDYMITDGNMEECDEGPLGGACCTDECRLKQGKACSDTNHRCCSNCQVVSADNVCDRAGNFTSDCRTDVYCNGVNATCPSLDTSGLAPPGNPCLLGRCRLNNETNSTECVDFCTFQNLSYCTCGKDDECKLCCMEADGECVNQNIALPTGTKCTGGSCLGGECRAFQDTISRIFDIIANLDVDDLALFMAENIVGFTLIFSLFVWLPGALVLHFCHDHQLWKKFKRDHPDYYRSLLEKLPLVHEFGELGSRSTSPIDDTPHPTYSHPSHGRLQPIPEKDEEDEDIDSTDGDTRSSPQVTLI